MEIDDDVYLEVIEPDYKSMAHYLAGIIISSPCIDEKLKSEARHLINPPCKIITKERGKDE